ncbi:MAG: hemerythrin domain-containing protein [Candidatus Brocadiia bacterium]
MSRADRMGRRAFFGAAATGGAAFMVRSVSPEEPPDRQAGISAAEDLMREHGVMDRLLLVYEEAHGAMSVELDVSLALVVRATRLVQDFIEAYHEQLEEEFIFPRMQEGDGYERLVRILRKQHEASRAVTSRILTRAEGAGRPAPVGDELDAYVRMYRPHMAREDTVLFPAMYGVIPPPELDELGEQFEEREHELFGDDGFAAVVDQVAEMEQELGIHDLAQFTPYA